MFEQIIVEIVLTSGFDWYVVDEQFPVIYDPYVEKYLAIGKTGAGRYILVDHCRIIS